MLLRSSMKWVRVRHRDMLCSGTWHLPHNRNPYWTSRHSLLFATTQGSLLATGMPCCLDMQYAESTSLRPGWLCRTRLNDPIKMFCARGSTPSMQSLNASVHLCSGPENGPSPQANPAAGKRPLRTPMDFCPVSQARGCEKAGRAVRRQKRHVCGYEATWGPP